MCESERDQATGVTAVPVQSVSGYLSLDKETGGRKREGRTECDKVPQSSVWHLAAGKV